MDEGNRSWQRWALGLAVLVAFGIGLWRSGSGEAPAPAEADARTSEAAVAPPQSDAEASAGASKPEHRIAERGRLTLRAEDLPADRPLTLALELDDEARGSEARKVRIGAQDGRQLETEASIAEGSGTGLTLEIDPRWLKPGHYLIEVKTAELTHFAFRRYALIVE